MNLVKSLVTVPTTEKGMLSPKVSKAIKEELIEKLKEFGFESNESGRLVLQVGTTDLDEPVYFKLETSVSKNRENSVNKSKKKKEEPTINLDDFLN